VRSTRERLREEALRLFVEKGYAATTIADIERAAGLAPRTGGFYRHFASKIELAAEVGRESVIETRADLGFDGVLPLGDTRAELVLIAKGYRQAADRQAPLMDLIIELRKHEEIRALEQQVTDDLLVALLDWLGEKKLARRKSRAQRTALLMNVFGGWFFYLSKRGAIEAGVTEEIMLEEWADFWARALDEGD